MNQEYPNLDEAQVGNFSVVFRHLAADPGYLENAPYSADVCEWFKRWQPLDADFKVGVDDLEAEARSLFQKLKKLESEIDGMEIKDRLTYLKTAHGLLDRLIILQERATNVKKYTKFQSDVLQILEEIMSPEQRTMVMDRLKDLSH